MPKLAIIGLDIEVSTMGRQDGMPLPHDPIISVVISNGGWYDKQFPDKCYILYTFGYHNEVEWEAGRHPVIMKMTDSEELVERVYGFLDAISPDFVSIHNGFNFDLRSLAASSVFSNVVGHTFEERRLGNVGVGVFWSLTNGTMIVDSMYTSYTIYLPTISLAASAFLDRLYDQLIINYIQIHFSPFTSKNVLMIYKG